MKVLGGLSATRSGGAGGPGLSAGPAQPGQLRAQQGGQALAALWGRHQRGALMVGIATAVIALDQWSKDWAQSYLGQFQCECHHVAGPLSFQLTTNRGAAFSLGTGAFPIVLAVAVGLAVAVVAYSRRAARGGVSLPVAIGLGLLSGGALSNLADRFVRHHHGAVVDFIRAASWWPVFNVADAAITVGALVLAATLLLASSKSPGAKPRGPEVEVSSPGRHAGP